MRKICYITVIDRVIKFFVSTHINALPDSDYRVTVVTNFENESSFSCITKNFDRFQINISRSVDPINFVKSVIKLKRFFVEEKFDVVQYTGPSTGLICSIAAKMAKIPVRVYCLWGIRFEGFTGIKRKIFTFFEKTTCKKSTHIIFDSPSNKAYCVDNNILPYSKAHVIGIGSACGINLKKFDIRKKNEYRSEIRKRWGVSEDSFVFGYLGRIGFEKGINELLESYKSVCDIYPKTILMIVGFLEEQNGIDQNLLQWSKETKNVIYCGRQDDSERFYSAFDVFVFPSHREGFGGGVIQAGALKVPSIVSNIGPLMDAIDGGLCGFSFRTKDYLDLINKMLYCIENRVEVFAKGDLIYDYVCRNYEELEWQAKYISFIKSILN